MGVGLITAIVVCAIFSIIVAIAIFNTLFHRNFRRNRRVMVSDSESEVSQESERSERREREAQAIVARRQEALLQRTIAPLEELYKNYDNKSFTVRVPAGRDGAQVMVETALRDQYSMEDLQKFKSLLKKGSATWTADEREFVNGINKNISNYLNTNPLEKRDNDGNFIDFEFQDLTVAQFKTALNAALEVESSQKGSYGPLIMYDNFMRELDSQSGKKQVEREYIKVEDISLDANRLLGQDVWYDRKPVKYDPHFTTNKRQPQRERQIRSVGIC